jgi:TonB family protein
MTLWIAQSSAILLATLCAVEALRRQSAAVRHLIWTVGLAASLIVPLLPPLLPSWSPVQVHEDAEVVLDAVTAVVAPTPAAASMQPVQSAPDIAFTIWLGGFMLAMAVLLAGGLRLMSLAFRGTTVTSERWIHAARDVSRALRLNRRIRLLHNPYFPTPGTWGILRGRIFVPPDAESWPDERVRIVLAHELAHIKRFDWIVQIIAESARAVHWFNPLFWIACKRLRQESEHSCDDAVLNLGIDGQAYAAHLLELARILKNSDRAWSSVLAMARPPHLERRFVAMLNPSLNRRPVHVATAGIIVVVAIGLTLPLAAMQARERTVVRMPAVAKPPALSVPARAVVASAVRPKPSPAPVRVVRPQEGSGSVSGIVRDTLGAVIPGTKATLSFIETRGHQETVSDEVGGFQFNKLLPGRYLLQVQLPGFQEFTRLIEIQGNERVQAMVILHVGSVQERVQVSAAGTPKPASNAPVPRRIRVGGNIQAARLISQVKPIYPASARDAGVEGTVQIQGIIGGDGSIVSLQVLNEAQVDPELANAARGAVSQWRYRPTLLNGTPVEVVTTIEVEFKLSQ